MNRQLAAVVVLAGIGFASPVVALDLNGNWGWTTTINDQIIESAVVFRFDSEGPVLTGVYRSNQSGLETPIANASFDDLGGDVTFSVTQEINGQPQTTHFRGMYNGNTITGKFRIERGGQSQSFVWVARRRK